MSQELYDRRRLLWIEALESDEYPQIEGALNRNNEGFCCLGVACEVAIKDGLDLDKDDSDSEVFYDGIGDELPARVVGWLGIGDEIHSFNPVLTPSLDPEDDGYVTCIRANDDLNMKFPQIARYLRKKWNL